MKIGNAVLAVLVLGSLLIGSSIMNSVADETPELEQGGWQKPTIEIAELELKNSTGMFKFKLNASGTSPEGTNRVEITFGELNGSKIEVAEDLWIEEGITNLIIFGSTLVQLEGPYNWSDWNFDIWMNVPSGGGIEGAISRLGGFFGLDTGNFSSEDMDIQNLTEMFQDNRFYLISRSYNATGAWGQTAYDLTDHIYTAILQFAIDEGWIDDPFADDDDDDIVPPEDDDQGKEKNEVSPWILIGIFVVGITALLIVISVVIYMALLSGKKEQ
jgi:hypothetical protein